MARIRSIKPEFFTDPDVVELSPFARLCFIGLWCLADRAGRLPDEPRRLGLQLFPGDQIDAEQLLDELERGRFVLRYMVNGDRYLQIRTFSRHQCPNKNETPSRRPPPPETGPGPTVDTPEANPGKAHDKHHASTIQAPYKHGASTVQAPDGTGTGTGTGTVRTPPGGRFASTLPPSRGAVRAPAPRAEGTERRTTTSAPKRRRRSQGDEPPGFAEFWQAYPRKQGRADALKAFRATLTAAQLPAVLAALERHVASDQWRDPQFIPYPAHWLRGKRWEDELPGAYTRRAIAPTLRDDEAAPWVCPHAPPCTSRSQCARLLELVADCTHDPRCTSNANHRQRLADDGPAPRPSLPH